LSVFLWVYLPPNFTAEEYNIYFFVTIPAMMAIIQKTQD
jgi:hypothetical protein